MIPTDRPADAPPVPSALPPARDYDELTARFRWNVPARFNMAEACCDAWAAIAPDRPCLIGFDAGTGLSFTTYGELHRRSMALAADLAARGVARGDRVALVLPQGVATAAAHMAVYRLGAIAVPLAMLFGPEALAYRFSMSGAKAAIVDGSVLARVREAGPPPVLYCTDGSDGDAADLEAIMASGSLHPLAPTGPDDPALMIFTSGTTGPPKGALHGHRVLIGHVPGVQVHHYGMPDDADVIWTPADWAWAGGLLDVLLPALMMGVPVVHSAPSRFDADLAVETLARTRTSRVFLPPTALRMMRGTAPTREALPALRTIGSGGEQLGAATREWAHGAFGLEVNEFYGQTECNLVLSGCAALGVADARAIGRAVPGHVVAVLGEDGPVPDGEVGEIAVASPDPVMFLRYWERPEATAAKFRGQWLMTGDRGVREGGLFRFEGREDDVITSAGYRIGPGEIEDCLTRHPDVALAAAVGKPDPMRTEIVKAYVVPARDVAPDEGLRQRLREHVRTRLSAHEYPREIEFVAELPLTTTGKVVRRDVARAGKGGSGALERRPVTAERAAALATTPSVRSSVA